MARPHDWASLGGGGKCWLREGDGELAQGGMWICGYVDSSTSNWLRANIIFLKIIDPVPLTDAPLPNSSPISLLF